MDLPRAGTVLQFALLAAGVALSTILYLQTRPPETEVVAARLSLAYYLDSAELTGTDDKGETLYKVRTKRASHVVADDSIAMNEVEMNYSPNGPQAWDLSSATGRIPADQNIIELNGNVVVQSGKGNSSATTITTEQLAVDPTSRQATTDMPVVVNYNGRRVNATGLEADLKRNRLKLLSDVSGKFSAITQ